MPYLRPFGDLWQPTLKISDPRTAVWLLEAAVVSASETSVD
jgi:hypothetical protein